jgi:hypothetical protein
MLKYVIWYTCDTDLALYGLVRSKFTQQYGLVCSEVMNYVLVLRYVETVQNRCFEALTSLCQMASKIPQVNRRRDSIPDRSSSAVLSRQHGGV